MLRASREKHMAPESNTSTAGDPSPETEEANAPPVASQVAPIPEPAVAAAPASADEPAPPSADEPASASTDGGEGGEAFATDSEPPADATAAAASEVPGEKKKRRRNRGKKPGAEAGTNAPDTQTEGVSEGEGRAKAKPKRKHAPPRERTAFHVGEEVFGRVTSVTPDAVMVDLSGKALAIFDKGELAADDLVPEVGDRFVAHVHNDGARGGFVVLTRKPLREEETKPRVEAAAQSGETVQGLVTGTIKGGLEVDIDGLRAFAPASHVELRPGADLAHLIGRRLEFTIAQYEKRGRDVVVSRKTFLEAEARELRKVALEKVEAGSIVKGIVRSVVQYGAFVAIPSADDIEGLVHMTEASHDRNARLYDIFKVGAEIDVKVLKVDDKGKLWLSHKAATPDPWEEAKRTFGAGTRHKGKVMRLQPFGAFIELAPGIEGLLHTSDLSYKRIEHANEVLKEGEELDVVVADFDPSSHKIALHPAPPPGEEDEPKQRVVVNKHVKVAVVAAEHSGLVVRVLGLTGRHSRGFIPGGHTGTERGTDLRRHFPPGTRLDAKVLELDPRRGEAKLSLRAFKEDTEKAAYNEYRASVAKVSKFGTLGDLLAKRK
jgi:small subunit ribosomal protein S1